MTQLASAAIVLAAVFFAAPAGAQTGQGNASAEGIRAQLVPRDFTTLSSEISARIDRIATRAGEHFKKGDVLVLFDCVAQRAQGAKMRAIELAAEKTVAVNEQLAALKSIGALELEVSKAEAAKARADVAIAEATVSKCAIAAPFSGVTVEERAHAFQYLPPGQPLLDILDDRSLEVEFLAPSSDLRWLAAGAPFEIHIDELDKSFPARVTRLGARIDPVSQSIKVTGEITGKADGLLAGMSGRVKLVPTE
jgi:membrane fusion protein, multidrug efflux system